MKRIATVLFLFISSIAVGQGFNNQVISHPNDISNIAFHRENTETVLREIVYKTLPRGTFLDTFSCIRVLMSNSYSNLHTSSNESNFSSLTEALPRLSGPSPDPYQALDSLPDRRTRESIEDSLDLNEKQVAFNIYAVPAEEEIMIEGVSYMAELTVYDLQGKKHEPTPSYPFHKGMRLNIHQLRSGIYVLHIKDEELNKMMKLVKK